MVRANAKSQTQSQEHVSSENASGVEAAATALSRSANVEEADLGWPEGLNSISAGVRMRQGTPLLNHGSASMKTAGNDPDTHRDPGTFQTNISLTLSRSEFRAKFSPEIVIDPHPLAKNRYLRSFGVDFKTGEPFVEFERSKFVIGLFNVDEKLRVALNSFINSVLAGSPLTKGGYDPAMDPCPNQTIETIKSNFSSLNLGDGEGENNDLTSRITSYNVGASVTLRERIEKLSRRGKGFAVPAGTTVSATTEFDGDPAKAYENYGCDAVACAKAIGFNKLSVNLNGEGLLLYKKGEPAVRLRQFTLSDGGKVDIQRYELVNPGLLAAGMDLLLPGLVEEMLESSLESAMSGLLGELNEQFPYVDLFTLLGIPSE